MVISFPSVAQEQNGCFMLDAKGKPVDLGNLCGGGNVRPTPPKAFQVPIKRREGGVPVIDVNFTGKKGKKTFEMLLDTGATATVLTVKMAQILEIVPEGAFLANTPSQNLVSFPVGRVASISTAGIVANNVTVAISPTLDIGLLGQNFFAGYDVLIRKDTIEFKAHK
jgi:aspartyl protease family protein